MISYYVHINAAALCHIFASVAGPHVYRIFMCASCSINSSTPTHTPAPLGRKMPKHKMFLSGSKSFLLRAKEESIFMTKCTLLSRWIAFINSYLCGEQLMESALNLSLNKSKMPFRDRFEGRRREARKKLARIIK